MMGRRCASAAVAFSLSELAFLLLFIAAGAAVLLYAELSSRLDEIRALEDEVAHLEEVLAEKENSIVPCWKRPGSPIPEIAGVLTVSGRTDYVLTHYNSGALRIEGLTGNPETDNPLIERQLAGIFGFDIAYANARNCYVRVRIENETNDFSLYKAAAENFKRVGLVVVNE